MALQYAGIEVEHREIELRNKPQSMLLASPKGTVPVLLLDGQVIDQSLDIMRWALGRSDPDKWSDIDESIAQSWIDKNDGSFKKLLDQYKYPNRDPEKIQEETLIAIEELMLKPMENALQDKLYLLGSKMTWVDIAIFPFIRQFSMVNPHRFDALPYASIQQWLKQHLQSELFNSVMGKYPIWMD
jgi:glutathione S-transferase